MKATRNYSQTNFPSWILSSVKKIHENFDALSETDPVLRHANAVKSAVAAYFMNLNTVLEVSEIARKDAFAVKYVLKKFRKPWDARRSRWMNDAESAAALDSLEFSASIEIMNIR